MHKFTTKDKSLEQILLYEKPVGLWSLFCFYIFFLSHATTGGTDQTSIPFFYTNWRDCRMEIPNNGHDYKSLLFIYCTCFDYLLAYVRYSMLVFFYCGVERWHRQVWRPMSHYSYCQSKGYHTLFTPKHTHREHTKTVTWFLKHVDVTLR